MNKVESTPELVSAVYEQSRMNISAFRRGVDRPLTLSEKILIGHFVDMAQPEPIPGKSYVFQKPDRVALQDVTGQMTILQFMLAGLKQTVVPTTVHCDHLIQARSGSQSDTATALSENSEVYSFLESASRKFGMGFWKPGAGIIHQVVLENYAFPGGLLIGTDSHTPNAGGLGMMAIGVGGLDAAETMAGFPWELLYPKRIGIFLTGTLSGWAAPKDIILYVVSKLTVSGGTNAIIEYFGPGTESISCTGKATITNMGAEIGATTSIFPYDKRMETYLRSTNRSNIADLADKNYDLLTQDQEIREDALRYFDQVIEIDLSSLEPYIVGPHTPDLARPISKMAINVKKKNYIDNISVALIGSCTNSSYEDMSRAASIAAQARDKNLKIKTSLLVTPGSEMIRSTIDRDGQIKVLQAIGATVLANACGPCIGQWNRPELKKGESNTIVTSYNRNFPGRNDGSRETMNFIASPELVIALALSGKISFNPQLDQLETVDGNKVKLDPPGEALEVPKEGFSHVTGIYVSPSETPDSVKLRIDPNSSRLQKLEPFPAWAGDDFLELPLLVKIRGKCTTDQISPAGAWLMYRGHLDKISDNLLLGAMNAFSEKVGIGRNILNNNIQPLPQIARDYKSRGIEWVIVGDNNYGEGSSREHAAMTPRYLGCRIIIAKSFARIHETNLKKQGILALTFSDNKDYDMISEGDKVSIIGLKNLKEGRPVVCKLKHSDGKSEQLKLNHSYSTAQINWFYAGSALNMIRTREMHST
ncbi:MAG TPA: aconitate hydratase [Nitrososphaeraceae archaeon]|jgi:aconitate hydratase